jgi:hypothetical protein
MAATAVNGRGDVFVAPGRKDRAREKWARVQWLRAAAPSEMSDVDLGEAIATAELSLLYPEEVEWANGRLDALREEQRDRNAERADLEEAERELAAERAREVLARDPNAILAAAENLDARRVLELACALPDDAYVQRLAREAACVIGAPKSQGWAWTRFKFAASALADRGNA